MKDFISFLEYLKEDENQAILLERVSRGYPKELTNEDAERLKEVQNLASSVTLAYLSAYHEWLNQQ